MPQKKISSIKDLDEIRSSIRQDQKLGLKAKEDIRVCIGGGCIASGSLEVKAAFEQALKEQGLERKISVIGTGCLGPCALGPVVLISKDNVFYQQVKPEDAKEIIEKHIIGGDIVERLTSVPIRKCLVYSLGIHPAALPRIACIL